MPRQRRAAPGQQWRRQLRNIPAHQAAAAPPPPAPTPAPPPPPPVPQAVAAPKPAAARAHPIHPRLKRPIRPAGQGQKNNDNIRLRNRRYKIKRIPAQPKNVQVRHRGQVVRQMVARRRAIYPALRRQRKY